MNSIGGHRQELLNTVQAGFDGAYIPKKFAADFNLGNVMTDKPDSPICSSVEYSRFDYVARAPRQPMPMSAT